MIDQLSVCKCSQTHMRRMITLLSRGSDLESRDGVVKSWLPTILLAGLWPIGSEMHHAIQYSQSPEAAERTLHHMPYLKTCRSSSPARFKTPSTQYWHGGSYRTPPRVSPSG